MVPDHTIVNWILGLMSTLIVLQIGWIAFLTRSLHSLSVHVASNYVHKDTLKAFDSRTTDVLDRMAVNIERLLESVAELKGRRDARE